MEFGIWNLEFGFGFGSAAGPLRLTRQSRIQHLKSKFTAAGMCLALSAAVAGENGSLPDLDIEYTEAKMMLDTTAQENAALHAQLRMAQEQVKSLTESLAIANAEGEVFKRETS